MSSWRMIFAQVVITSPHASANGATIERTDSFRIFFVGSNGDLTLNDLTVSGGSATNGGGIFNSGGTVTLNGSSISDNTADNGGGIFNNVGTVVLNGDSNIHYNTASSDGGGMYSFGGTVTLNGSIRDNTATVGGEIGRASCRERVYILVGAVSL